MTGSRVDLLVLRWYVDLREEPPGVPERWLATCREHFPPALPHRFGDSEPLRGRLERDGDAAFVRAFARADPLVHHSGRTPALGGSLGTPTRMRRLGSMTSHSLDVRLDAADDPRLRGFFVAVAEGSRALFASASVRRDVLQEGADLTIDRHDPDVEPYLAPLGQWLGLPPRPPRWAWFGPAYTRLVRRHLSGGEPTGTGVLHVGLRDRVPADLIARLDEVDPVRRPARRMPRRQRTTLWRLVAGR